VYGGEGNDLIEDYRDGSKDIINCGPGHDLYYKPDPIDEVSGCEELVEPIHPA
jgi:hypothetical protein